MAARHGPGRIRRRPDGRIFLDFPGAGKAKRRLWSLKASGRPEPFTLETAHAVLDDVRRRLAAGETLERAIAPEEKA